MSRKKKPIITPAPMQETEPNRDCIHYETENGYCLQYGAGCSSCDPYPLRIEVSPAFTSIMEKINRMTPAERDSLQGRQLYLLAFYHAPKELQQLLNRSAMQMLPPPTYCNEQGEPVYSLAELATFYGITTEEAQAQLDEARALIPAGIIEEIHTAHQIH